MPPHSFPYPQDRYEDDVAASPFPQTCRVVDPKTLIAFKSEIDRLCLIGMSLDRTPKDKALMHAAYLLVNYKLNVKLPDERGFVRSTDNVRTAHTVVELVSHYNLNDPTIAALLELCQRCIRARGSLDDFDAILKHM